MIIWTLQSSKTPNESRYRYKLVLLDSELHKLIVVRLAQTEYNFSHGNESE